MADDENRSEKDSDEDTAATEGRSNGAEERTKAAEERTKAAEERTKDAEKRTNFAEDRTIQATERTFAGWMRTSFAAIGVGIAFHALFGDFEPPWLAKAIATLFILMAAVVAFTAGNRARASFKRLNSHEIDAPTSPNLLWISWSVVAGALVLIAALWLLHNGGP